MRANDFIFVNGAGAELGKEQLPDAGRAAIAHGMDAAVPAIEVADDADATSAGRPDGEVHAGDTIDGFDVGAELFVGVVVTAFAHEVEVEFSEEKREGVGVEIFGDFAVTRAEANAIAGRGRGEFTGAGENSFEKTFRTQFAHFQRLGAILENVRFDRTRLEKADGPAAAFGRFDGMWTENAEGIRVARNEEGIETSAELVSCRSFGRSGGFVRHGSILSETGSGTNGRDGEYGA